MDAERFRESFEFSCRCCDWTWQETYDVCEFEDRQGGSWVYYARGGAPSASPSAVVQCPKCRQLGVRYRSVGRPLSGQVGSR
jgi:hypothetical protein